MPRLRRLLAAAALAAACAPAVAWQGVAARKDAPAPHDAQAASHADTAPEAATGFLQKSAVLARRHMVVAANPYAAEAGESILRAGGTAVDAAITVQLVLNLVEPQSSGIGGGALMMVLDGDRLRAYDGRETAPAAVGPDLFKSPEGKSLGYADAVIGGRATGVPGVLRMLELAHRQHGKLPWARLFAPAIALADKGFRVSPRLHKLASEDPFLRLDPVAAAYFYDAEGRARPVGTLLKNPALAATLRTIAAHGADAFYDGPIARAIVDKVRGHARNPGAMTLADLQAYRALERSPVCSDYRRWTVCGAPPPSSGGIAIAQMLGIFEQRDMAALRPRDGKLTPEAIHVFAEAGRLAYADRARYVADTDFVALPGGSPAALLDKTYLAQRAALIDSKSMGQAKPGQPLAGLAAAGDDRAPELPATSHFSIVDGAGRAVAMTTTIESAFGSRQMVAGFLLNNQLTDFSFDAADANGPVANRVEGGKRPRSAMSPTLVFDKGTRRLQLSVGSPGGSSIINYVAKVLVGTLDWGLDIQQAIDLPNVGSRNGPTELERGFADDALVDALKARGHAVRVMEQTSGLHGFQRIEMRGKTMWLGGADPRREGVARGQ